MPQTALIVDDDAISRLMMSSMLVPTGIDCRFADTADSLWRQLAARPQLLIIDPGPPAFAGLVHELRRRSALPLLIHTPCPEQFAGLVDRAAGGCDILAKPCCRSDLLAKVRGLLASSRSPGAAPGRAYRPIVPVATD
jgi:DNA-binding response OmpR family regulator